MRRVLIGLAAVAVCQLTGGGGFAQEVLINEIHFDPVDNTSREEFLELHNPGGSAVDLSGWFFSNGVELRIPGGVSIAPGGFLVIAEDPPAFRTRFGFDPDVGPYVGRLSSTGEILTLRDPDGVTVDRVDYRVGFPWPVASAGDGASLELVHPDLDNDLGSSWRASGLSTTEPRAPRYFVRAATSGWLYREGRSEASNPIGAWRELDFRPNATWSGGRTPIGYGDGDDNTELDDMRGSYSTVYLRRTFEVEDVASLPPALRLRAYFDDGCIVWINGVEVGRFSVSAGEKRFDDFAISHEANWDEADIASPAALFREGENVVAVHALNTTLDSSDFSIDIELLIPGSDGESAGVPTPGVRNSVYSTSVPPNIRQVSHDPQQAPSGVPVRVSAKVTDPDGVGSVTLSYQLVEPGDYIPAFLPLSLSVLRSDPRRSRQPNPEFLAAASWTEISMVDDGSGIDLEPRDDIFTALIPPQANRTLVRYRITVTDTDGNAAVVPYADDPSMNFAAFVHDGVPAYETTRRSVHPDGAGHTYPAAIMTSLPVYHVITRNQDVVNCVAASGGLQISQGTEARFIENWEAAFVYEGEVYDHVRYRLRGANGRYQVPPGNPGGTAGKRHWRFQFNKGRHLRARDRYGKLYPTRWRILNTGRMFGNRLDGSWGLGDQVNDVIWRAYDVPAPFGHAFHWRMVDGAEEAPGGADGQYHGDFWGIARAFENYDVRFLEAHGLPKGNLYKLVNQTNDCEDQQRYQAPDAPSGGVDHRNIEDELRSSRSSSWLDAYVNYDAWYRYHSIVQAIRHYDYWPSANKNATWYFEPDYRSQNGFLGRMWTLPFDADATWGPTWNGGQDRPWEAIHGGGGKAAFQRAYRNHIREVRDLLWQRDQLELVVRQVASFMDRLEEPDIDRWKSAPSAAGRQWFSASSQGTVAGKVADMMRFAFTGGSWPGGSVGGGGRAAFLDSLADGPDGGRLPRRPTLTYTGEDGYPSDGLSFRSSAFSDPQGPGTFAAMQWRVAEVADVNNPGAIPLSSSLWTLRPAPLEIVARWRSAELTTQRRDLALAAGIAAPLRRYRVRVRMKDSTGLWSHWSTPVDFRASEPALPVPVVEHLRVTELHYNPIGGNDFEFVELFNTGARSLDLTNVFIDGGIEFAFEDGDIRTLDPGDHVVVVRDPLAFSVRYDTAEMPIAGKYSGRLDNAGETVLLRLGDGITIQEFTYEDWHPDTDGLGHSMEVVDVLRATDAWSQPWQWAPSASVHGTPGESPTGVPLTGGFRLPGDVNADRRLDISDAVTIVRRLFVGVGAELPCEGATMTAGGNLTLHDANGDDGVDVSDAVYLLDHLYGGGPAPVHGETCVRLEGCRNDCEF